MGSLGGANVIDAPQHCHGALAIIASCSSPAPMSSKYVLSLDRLRMTDVASVGGKNASLGELISQLAASGVRVPGGFATTAQAFDDFLAHNKLAERIEARLAGLDIDDMGALSAAGTEIRGWLEHGELPPELVAQVRAAYEKVAEGSPKASFAV